MMPEQQLGAGAILSLLQAGVEYTIAYADVSFRILRTYGLSEFRCQ